MSEDNKSPQTSIDIGTVANQFVNVAKVHLNVSQEVVITTEDKIRICLTEHLKRMEKKHEWIAPFGVLITIIITFATSTFNKFIFDAATWQAIFVIAGLIAIIWLMRTLPAAFKTEKIEDIISKLKKGAQITTKHDMNIGE